jgi:LmbE family N-acetylglucosaminyl deacetylase
MLPLKLDNPKDGLSVLFLAAHCDDIEIGCGGTIIRMGETYKAKRIKWLVFTSTPERAEESRKSADYFLANFQCPQKDIIILDFKDGHMPYHAEKVKAYFEDLKSFQPDVIFTHFHNDLHQDHRFLSELTWNTFRDHLIFEYEIPKYDGDLGNPNFFVPLKVTIAEKKVQGILTYFPSQSGKQWFDRETFFSMMRIRGFQSASKSRYAEAFYLRKSVF